MAEILKTEDFLAAFGKLPRGIQELFRTQEERFKMNWLDPRLHTKRLKDLPGVYSFRITRRYRALFYFRGEDAVLFAVGHRKEGYES